MTAGVRGLFINGQVDQADETLEQLLQLRHQQPVAQRNCRLGRQRLGQTLIGLGEAHHVI